MRPSEDKPADANKALSKHNDYSLFFFETIDGRTYLRFTRFAVILILGLTVISIVSILVIFLMSSQQMASEPVNINVSVPLPSPYLPNKPILKRPPPAPRLPTAAQPVHSMPTPSNTPPLKKNSNGQTNTKQTPQSPRSSTSESPP